MQTVRNLAVPEVAASQLVQVATFSHQNVSGAKLDSRWGPALVLERSDDPVTGTYFLLKLFPHGYHGKDEAIGSKRTDVDPRRLVPA